MNPNDRRRQPRRNGGPITAGLFLTLVAGSLVFLLQWQAANRSSSSPLQLQIRVPVAEDLHLRPQYTDTTAAATTIGATEDHGVEMEAKWTAPPTPAITTATTTTTATEKAVSGDPAWSTFDVPRLEEPFFCTPEVSDLDAWNLKKKNHDPVFMTGLYMQKGSHLPTTPTFFCDKLHNNLNPWKVTDRYTTDDVVVGLFSGENLYYSRANACRDTWLREYKHWYIYAATTDTAVPITGLEQYNVLPYETRHSDTQKVQLYGLLEMYRNHPDKKWYGIWGDDTLLHPDYTLNLLAPYNSSEDLWISAGGWTSKMKSFVRVEKYPKYPKYLKDANEFSWSSGAFGWFLSHSVMKDFAEHIEEFMNENTPSRICFCPDKVTGLLLSLLGYEITKLPKRCPGGDVNQPDTGSFGSCQSAMLASAVDARIAHAHLVQEYVLYHYLSPLRMVAADERMKHEKLDRIINMQGAASGKALLAFYHRQLDTHAAVRLDRSRELSILGRRARGRAGENFNASKYAGWVVDASRVDAEIRAHKDEVWEMAHRQQWKELHARFRLFISSHFDLLRTLQSAVSDLANIADPSQRRYDIPALA